MFVIFQKAKFARFAEVISMSSNFQSTVTRHNHTAPAFRRMVTDFLRHLWQLTDFEDRVVTITIFSRFWYILWHLPSFSHSKAENLVKTRGSLVLRYPHLGIRSAPFGLPAPTRSRATASKCPSRPPSTSSPRSRMPHEIGAKSVDLSHSRGVWISFSS